MSGVPGCCWQVFRNGTSDLEDARITEDAQFICITVQTDDALVNDVIEDVAQLSSEHDSIGALPLRKQLVWLSVRNVYLEF